MKKILMVVMALSLLAGCVETTDNSAENKPTSSESENTDVNINEGEQLSPEQIKEAKKEMEEIEKAAAKEIEENYKLVRELEDSEDAKKAGGKAKGSCNAIDDSSTCLEFYGDFWTEQQIKLNCEGSGTFSTKGCPNDMAGGCNTGVGTPADMVAWMYLRGGGEMTAESLKYAQMACDATLASKWIKVK